MEQARCWMWTKEKHGNLSSRSNIQGSTMMTATPKTTNASSYDDSWEEQAFAEDAAGPLGGCIWPPRSYSCSFCRREFRSAQALGGHMNVHRRDRARLKQSSSSTSPHNEFLHQQQQHHHQNNHHIQNNPCTSSLGVVQYNPSQVCALVYNPNPNSDYGGGGGALGVSLSSPSRVALSAPKDNSSSIIHQKRSHFSVPQSWSNFVPDRYFRSTDSKTQEDNKTMDFVKPADLSVSLNLVLCRTLSAVSGNDEEEEEEEEEEETNIRYKKRRIDQESSSSLPLFLKLSSSSPKVREHNPSSLEDLDLELRLGDPPKVK